MCIFIRNCKHCSMNISTMRSFKILNPPCGLNHPLAIVKNRALHVTQVDRFRISQNSMKKIPHNLKGKPTGAQKWLTRQLNDPYVKLAQHESYRCRSAFKLLEIDDRFKILQPGQTVIDCGAAPGSWSQVAVKKTNALAIGSQPQGRVISVDLQDMPPLEGATVLSLSDFTTIQIQLQILEHLAGKRADLVISDMAPQATGIRSMDHELIVDLCQAALKFAVNVSAPGASFLCKLWHGSDHQSLEAVVKKFYANTKWVKPQASRTHSAEIFLLARNFNGI